ncbi:hypothetical protein CON90_15510 [Bacillus toyonensis]|nr:hypothetical protein CON90_15510 [Bacillus toyonensis]PEL52501.1 hypothetical protein CN633_30175 [Bacillus toyonensis]
MYPALYKLFSNQQYRNLFRLSVLAEG